jgi:hypothetical protein
MIAVLASSGTTPNGYDSSGHRSLSSITQPFIHASRIYGAIACMQTVDRSYWYFLDVGAWQGGPQGNPTTSFGLICENHILLCSWLNRVEGGREPGSLPSEIQPLPAQVRDFFAGARRLSLPPPSQRAFVIAAARVPGRPLTDPGGMLAVFPDLHLHAYRRQPVDRFQYRQSPGDATLSSLDEEMRAALDLCAELGAATVQAGDMYEVWETEILLRLHYREMLESATATRERFGRGVRLREDIAYQLETGRVLRRDILLRHETYWRDHALSAFSRDHVDEHGIDFRSTDDICAKIRAAHSPLFGNRSQIFDHELRGNHDNFAANRYWSTVAGDEYRNNSLDARRYLRAATSASSRPRNLNIRLGREGSIWIEHGHRYDWHNNDHDWWMDGRGFGMVFLFVAGFVSTNVGKRTEAGGDWALSVADWWSDITDTEMRLYCLRRADEIVQSDRNVRVVVTGHTHTPAELEAQCRMPLGPTNTGWDVYRRSEEYRVQSS